MHLVRGSLHMGRGSFPSLAVLSASCVLEPLSLMLLFTGGVESTLVV